MSKENTAEDEKHHTGGDEFAGLFKRDPLQTAKSDAWKKQIQSAFEDVEPAEDGQEHRQACPDVVKADDQGPHRQSQERVEEVASGPFAAEENEEFGPFFMSGDVRKAHQQKIESGNELDGSFHE